MSERPGEEPEPWRAGGSWRPTVRPGRLPPFVAAMLPCGSAAYALGHVERRLPLPLEVLCFCVVVLACAAPMIATHFADAFIVRLEEGEHAPPRALAARCVGLGVGALAAAYLPAAVVGAAAGAVAYEAVALFQIRRSLRERRPMR